ncbi:MAG TPA: RNA methyltransferase [Anaerolineaceae bacterium]|nr:RNA methyltransferase [Anaerolineaceae bacterium]
MITSTHNPQIQRVRALLSQAKERREAGAFVVEGVRLLEEAWRAGWPVELVLYSERLNERGRHLLAQMADSGAQNEEVAAHVLDSLSDTVTSQGILAVLRRPTTQGEFSQRLDFAVIADTIRDPGNLGSLLRTATAAGAQAAILSPGCADVFSPKVIRAGMGAHFSIPILELGWEEIRQLVRQPTGSAPLTVYLADIHASLPYWQADLRRPSAIMVSNEAEGASAEGKALADELVLIPMPGQSESLNAAIAAGILLFDVVRQRSSNQG